MARTRSIPKIIAKDCMPFYKNGEANMNSAITENVDKNKIDNDALKLRKFVESIVPVSIFGSDLKDEDIDSKLAYTPFENQPFPFKSGDVISYQRVWQAGRYVGSSQINDTIIEILPRFGKGWLEYILNDITHFKIVESGSEDNSSLFDLNDLMRRILWHMWVRKFASADKYGVPKHVVKRTYIGMKIRGHLNVRKSLFPLFTKGQVVSKSLLSTKIR